MIVTAWRTGHNKCMRVYNISRNMHWHLYYYNTHTHTHIMYYTNWFTFCTFPWFFLQLNKNYYYFGARL